jgi:hypothetical protein
MVRVRVMRTQFPPAERRDWLATKALADPRLALPGVKFGEAKMLVVDRVRKLQETQRLK